ncbi:uncharacterized protein LOC122527549 isoform X1 [Frieseomelitta varia]|uniref:uncharacterized protein LOC122527549 isoform X1 n=1 Tax=Frieseomelitta varia TaxID=561572 RepID=UPI001CB68D0B|nr:uncharacterized protein LOC122527549 isoform X1 [Frieseomelitta varia]
MWRTVHSVDEGSLTRRTHVDRPRERIVTLELFDRGSRFRFKDICKQRRETDNRYGCDLSLGLKSNGDALMENGFLGTIETILENGARHVDLEIQRVLSAMIIVPRNIEVVVGQAQVIHVQNGIVAHRIFPSLWIVHKSTRSDSHIVLSPFNIILCNIT